jgi:hypothetical protein
MRNTNTGFMRDLLATVRGSDDLYASLCGVLEDLFYKSGGNPVWATLRCDLYYSMKRVAANAAFGNAAAGRSSLGGGAPGLRAISSTASLASLAAHTGGLSLGRNATVPSGLGSIAAPPSPSAPAAAGMPKDPYAFLLDDCECLVSMPPFTSGVVGENIVHRLRAMLPKCNTMAPGAAGASGAAAPGLPATGGAASPATAQNNAILASIVSTLLEFCAKPPYTLFAQPVKNQLVEALYLQYQAMIAPLQPVDLSEMKQKAQQGAYGGSMELLRADILRMVEACEKYNKKERPVLVTAVKEVKKRFEAMAKDAPKKGYSAAGAVGAAAGAGSGRLATGASGAGSPSETYSVATIAMILSEPYITRISASNVISGLMRATRLQRGISDDIADTVDAVAGLLVLAVGDLAHSTARRSLTAEHLSAVLGPAPQRYTPQSATTSFVSNRPAVELKPFIPSQLPLPLVLPCRCIQNIYVRDVLNTLRKKQPAAKAGGAADTTDSSGESKDEAMEGSGAASGSATGAEAGSAAGATAHRAFRDPVSTLVSLMRRGQNAFSRTAGALVWSYVASMIHRGIYFSASGISRATWDSILSLADMAFPSNTAEFMASLDSTSSAATGSGVDLAGVMTLLTVAEDVIRLATKGTKSGKMAQFQVQSTVVHVAQTCIDKVILPALALSRDVPWMRGYLHDALAGTLILMRRVGLQSAAAATEFFRRAVAVSAPSTASVQRTLSDPLVSQTSFARLLGQGAAEPGVLQPAALVWVRPDMRPAVVHYAQALVRGQREQAEANDALVPSPVAPSASTPGGSSAEGGAAPVLLSSLAFDWAANVARESEMAGASLATPATPAPYAALQTPFPMRHLGVQRVWGMGGNQMLSPGTGMGMTPMTPFIGGLPFVLPTPVTPDTN